MMSAGRIPANRPGNHREEGGAAPTPALQELLVALIPHWTAKSVLRHHYLGTLPGGTKLSFGIFHDGRLEGVVTLGCGPFNGHKVVAGATADDYLCLTRLWLSDRLPIRSESRVLGVVARLIRKHTNVRFLFSYADPAQGHRGVVYQAAGWSYLGRSSAMSLYSVNGGKAQHSRSLAHRMGSHSVRFLRSRGLDVKTIPQGSKHRYLLFLDRSWEGRMRVTPQPYPKEV